MDSALIMLAMVACCGAAEAQYLDGNFGSWKHQTWFDNGFSSWNLLTAAGSPAPCIEVTNSLNPQASQVSVAASVGWMPSAVWNPVQQGPLSQVELELDHRFISGDKIMMHAVGLAVLQSGRFYIDIRTLLQIPSGWTHVVLPAAKDIHLVEIINPAVVISNSHPNFTNGSTLTFGFVVYSVMTQNPRSTTHQYDNWSIKLRLRGSFTTFGFGCPCVPPGPGVPIIGSYGMPGLGFAGFRITGNGPILVHGLLMLGVSDKNWNGLPLPFPLVYFGAPGCYLLNGNDFCFVTLSDSTGYFSIPLSIPNSSVYLNSVFFCQWCIISPGANPAGICMSPGGKCRID